MYNGNTVKNQNLAKKRKDDFLAYLRNAAAAKDPDVRKDHARNALWCIFSLYSLQPKGTYISRALGLVERVNKQEFWQNIDSPNDIEAFVGLFSIGNNEKLYEHYLQECSEKSGNLSDKEEKKNDPATDFKNFAKSFPERMREGILSAKEAGNGKTSLSSKK